MKKLLITLLIVSTVSLIFYVGRADAGVDNRIFEYNFYISTASRPFKIILFDGDVVKHKTALITPTGTGIQSYTPPSPIDYTVGWDIGVWYDDLASIPYAGVGDFDYKLSVNPDPALEDTITWTATLARTYSINGEDGDGNVVIGNSSIVSGTTDSATSLMIVDRNVPAIQGSSPTSETARSVTINNGTVNISNGALIIQ